MGGNKACCISRGAPSPDGIPPRPVVIAADSEQPEPPLQADKAPVLSWPSRLSKPEDQADLNAIFDEAVDASDGEGKASIISNRFSQVRVKLRKHLSRDSGFSKRASRSSQGNSDESAARREELRRIQKKRIQEELRNSEEYDEDARSVGLSALGSSSRRVTGESAIIAQEVGVVVSSVASLSRRHSFSTTENRSESRSHVRESGRRRRSSVPDMPPEPALRPKKLPSIDDSLPRRSSWRLSFSSSRRASQLRALSQDHTATQALEDSKTSIVEIEPIEVEAVAPAAAAPATPTSPVTTANYLKWLRGQGLRLPSPSLDASHGNDHLHIHGAHPDTTASPEPPSFGGVDGQQEQPVSFATRLHHLHISQRLASSTKGALSYASSSRQPSIMSNLTSEENFQSITTAAPRKGRNTSSSEITEGKIPQSWGQVLQQQQDGASSFYLSDASQTTETPRRQTRHSMPTSSEMNGSADTTTELLVPLPAVVLTQPDETKPISLSKQRAPGERRPSKKLLRRSESDITIAGALLGGSRNFLSGVWKKETPAPEPVVEPHLEGLLGRRKTSSVVKSVFIEQFDEIDKPMRKSSSRSSFLSAIGLPRLGKLSTRSYDGSLDHSNTVPKRKAPGLQLELPKPGGSPTRSISQKTPDTPDLWKKPELESTEVMWHKAIRASIDARAMGIRKEFELVQPSPMTIPTMIFPKMPRRSGDKSLEDIADDSEDEADETTRLSRNHSMHSPGNHVHTLQVPKLTYDRAAPETIEFAQNALSAQLAIQGASGPQRLGVHGSQSPISQHAPDSPSGFASRSAADTRRNTRISFKRRVTPPETWARFPSHDREQRCASAGAADKVQPTDFATLTLDDGTEVFVTGQRKHLHRHHEKEGGHKHHASLPDRISMKIRTSVDKLRTKQSTALNDAVLGRRSSTSAGGHLKEPELELLPSLDIREMTETKMIQIEAEEENRRKEREARMIGRLPLPPHGSDGIEEDLLVPFSHEEDEGHPGQWKQKGEFHDTGVTDIKTTAVSVRSVVTFEDIGSADMMSDEERVMSKRSKFGTWSGKDKGKMAERMADRELRKSTVDFELQARLMEKTEREILLNAAESMLTTSSSGMVREFWRDV